MRAAECAAEHGGAERIKASRIGCWCLLPSAAAQQPHKAVCHRLQGRWRCCLPNNACPPPAAAAQAHTLAPTSLASHLQWAARPLHGSVARRSCCLAHRCITGIRLRLVHLPGGGVQSGQTPPVERGLKSEQETEAQAQGCMVPVQTVCWIRCAGAHSRHRCYFVAVEMVGGSHLDQRLHARLLHLAIRLQLLNQLRARRAGQQRRSVQSSCSAAALPAQASTQVQLLLPPCSS